MGIQQQEFTSFSGESGDTKPTAASGEIPLGATFFEDDSRIQYAYSGVPYYWTPVSVRGSSIYDLSDVVGVAPTVDKDDTVLGATGTTFQNKRWFKEKPVDATTYARTESFAILTEKLVVGDAAVTGGLAYISPLSSNPAIGLVVKGGDGTVVGQQARLFLQGGKDTGTNYGNVVVGDSNATSGKLGLNLGNLLIQNAAETPTLYVDTVDSALAAFITHVPLTTFLTNVTFETNITVYGVGLFDQARFLVPSVGGFTSNVLLEDTNELHLGGSLAYMYAYAPGAVFFIFTNLTYAITSTATMVSTGACVVGSSQSECSIRAGSAATIGMQFPTSYACYFDSLQWYPGANYGYSIGRSTLRFDRLHWASYSSVNVISNSNSLSRRNAVFDVDNYPTTGDVVEGANVGITWNSATGNFTLDKTGDYRLQLAVNIFSASNQNMVVEIDLNAAVVYTAAFSVRNNETVPFAVEKLVSGSSGDIIGFHVDAGGSFLIYPGTDAVICQIS